MIDEMKATLVTLRTTLLAIAVPLETKLYTMLQAMRRVRFGEWVRFTLTLITRFLGADSESSSSSRSLTLRE